MEVRERITVKGRFDRKLKEEVQRRLRETEMKKNNKKLKQTNEEKVGKVG